MPRFPRLAASALAGALALAAFSAAAEDVCFSPQGGCAQLLLDRIAAARKTVDVEMYYFTSADLANALTAAAARGVRVRLVLDEGQETLGSSQGRRLADAGVQVRYERAPGLLHAKLAIFDGREAAVGSYNWTRRAEEENVEVLMFVDDAEYVEAFRQHFAGVWATAARARKEKAPRGGAAPEDGYVASALSTRFHVASCVYAGKISAENRVYYASREEALAAGKRPCLYCCP